jgi:hypothetical protein
MKNLFGLFAASLLFTTVAFCHTPQEATKLPPQGFETTLASGMNLRLHLHDGDFRVIGSDSDKLSIHVEGKNLEQAKNIKIQLKRSGTAVDLTLSHVPKKEKICRSRSKSRELQTYIPACMAVTSPYRTWWETRTWSSLAAI